MILTQNPLVTLIMPVRNEANVIARSLSSVLEQQSYPGQIEVLVTDGLSTDGTRQIVQSFQERHPNLSLFDNPGRIVPTGLNAALHVAKGEIIIRVDGHTEIAPDFVYQCVAELRRTQADNVGGKMVAVGTTVIGRAVALATSSPFGVGVAKFHYSDKEEWVDTVYMGAWRRDVFDRIGLFDEEMVRNQDDEFNYRLLEHGGRILLSPKIKSKYIARSTVHTLCSQYFQYGYWKVRVMQKHPRQMKMRQFVPPIFVAALLGLFLLAFFTSLGKVLLVIVAGSYALANLAASVLTASRSGWRHLFLLPVVFTTLHLSYGLGFLVGLVRFANRWRDNVDMFKHYDIEKEYSRYNSSPR